MNNEQFHLMIECISTFDHSTGEFLSGVDRNGHLIYIDKKNPPLDKNNARNSKRSHHFLIKDHSQIKAAFKYEDNPSHD